MTARTLTSGERLIREHVLAVNLGRCCLCGRYRAENYAHRLPEGQGGPYLPANGLGLCGSGTTGCHGASERRREVSYAYGWLIHRRDRETPAQTAARIAATPALIRSPLAPDGAYHVLDWLDEHGRATWLPRLAEPAEVAAAGLLDETLAEALADLGRAA